MPVKNYGSACLRHTCVCVRARNHCIHPFTAYGLLLLRILPHPYSKGPTSVHALLPADARPRRLRLRLTIFAYVQIFKDTGFTSTEDAVITMIIILPTLFIKFVSLSCDSEFNPIAHTHADGLAHCAHTWLQRRRGARLPSAGWNYGVS